MHTAFALVGPHFLGRVREHHAHTELPARDFAAQNFEQTLGIGRPGRAADAHHDPPWAAATACARGSLGHFTIRTSEAMPSVSSSPETSEKPTSRPKFSNSPRE